MNRKFKNKAREETLKRYFINKRTDTSRKTPSKLTEEQKNERKRKLKEIALKNKTKQSDQSKIETVEMIDDNQQHQKQEQEQEQPYTCSSTNWNWSWNIDIISDSL